MRVWRVIDILPRGYWHRVESCQVTLISEHDLKLAGRGNAFDFSKGSHRRNLVVAGLKTKALQGRVFRIGEAMSDLAAPVMALVRQLDESARAQYIDQVIETANGLMQGDTLAMKGSTWIACAHK